MGLFSLFKKKKEEDLEEPFITPQPTLTPMRELPLQKTATDELISSKLDIINTKLEIINNKLDNIQAQLIKEKQRY